MLSIIEIKARPDGGHGLQSQSHRTECWLPGWVAVPEELTAAVWECGGYCELELDGDGNLVGIIPTEKPVPEEPAPTEADRLEAQVTYTAMMTDTLLEVE